MVVINVKGSDRDGFLYKTTTEIANDDLIESLVEIHNEQLRAKVIADSVRGLALYGPMKEPTQVGIDEIKEKYAGEKLINLLITKLIPLEFGWVTLMKENYQKCCNNLYRILKNM